MKMLKLSNGQEVQIKRLGALSQARALGVISDIISDERIQSGYSFLSDTAGKSASGKDQVGILAPVINAILGDHIDKIMDLVLLVSNLAPEDLEKDGDTSINLQDIMAILTAAWEENDISKALDKLGNAPKPLNAGGANRNERRAQTKAHRSK